jgi:hypothetical protein
MNILVSVARSWLDSVPRRLHARLARILVMGALTAALWSGTAQAQNEQANETSSSRAISVTNLFAFDSIRPGNILTNDAGYSLEKSARGTTLKMALGHKTTWPGITLKAPEGHWNLSPFAQINVSLKNTGTNRATLNCRVDNPGADGTKNCRTDAVSLDPGQTGVIHVELKRNSSDKLGGKLFGMRGYPVGYGGEDTVDPTNITQLLLFVSNPTASQSFEVASVQASGVYTSPTAGINDSTPFFPFIDTFGQYRHKDWPDKTHSEKELLERRQREVVELESKPGPSDWDQYGGWISGPQLKGTGFFRTEKYKEKWWLVDPDGRLFFSQGIDCVLSRDTTPIDERASWFEEFPGDKPEFTAFLGKGYALKGHYAGKTPACFSFSGANSQRKYGTDYKRALIPIVHTRLRSWGLNTIGMWSDGALFRPGRSAASGQSDVNPPKRTPYVDAIGTHDTPRIAASEGYWGQFPDVFAPQFKEGLRKAMAGKVGGSAGDPWCLGYFADNEMSWGDESSLALATLRCPADQPAKIAFISDLKNKYTEIAKLNETWGTTFDSWNALLEGRTTPDKEKAKEDLLSFYSRIARQYFKTVRDTIKEVAPNQLYLGCRFAWVNSNAAAAAAEFCDVVSYNLYQRSVVDFKFNGNADVPLIIGEFHFGALDRGMFHTGLVSTPSQKARAEAYSSYVRGVLNHPSFVGCHWFQYQDEPVIGRVYDEENYQIGFIDVADTPYRETIEASRMIGQSLYRYRLLNQRTLVNQ